MFDKGINIRGRKKGDKLEWAKGETIGVRHVWMYKA